MYLLNSLTDCDGTLLPFISTLVGPWHFVLKHPYLYSLE